MKQNKWNLLGGSLALGTFASLVFIACQDPMSLPDAQAEYSSAMLNSSSSQILASLSSSSTTGISSPIGQISSAAGSSQALGTSSAISSSTTGISFSPSSAVTPSSAVITSSAASSSAAVSSSSVIAASKTMSLQVSTAKFATSCQNGSANVAVAYVTNASGTFVRTLKLYAGVRMQYLAQWKSASGTTQGTGSSTIDGYSGATRATNASPAFNFTWNLKDKAGATVPDGSYILKMEGSCDNVNDQRTAQATFSISKGVLSSTSSSNPTYFNITSWTLQ